jgi:hypothetical protein
MALRFRAPHNHGLTLLRIQPPRQFIRQRGFPLAGGPTITDKKNARRAAKWLNRQKIDLRGQIDA